MFNDTLEVLNLIFYYDFEHPVRVDEPQRCVFCGLWTMKLVKSNTVLRGDIYVCGYHIEFFTMLTNAYRNNDDKIIRFFDNFRYKKFRLPESWG